MVAKVHPHVTCDDAAEYAARFVNEFGERYEFRYDRKVGQGTLAGDETDWEALDVIGGRVPGFLLGVDESELLCDCWEAATGERPVNVMAEVHRLIREWPFSADCLPSPRA